MSLLDRSRAALVVIDVQEAFRKAVDGFDDVATRAGTLVEAAHALGLPVIVTEQYPKGLGATVSEVADRLEGESPLAKTVFDGSAADGFDLHGRDQVLLCGVETHVCVHQTAAALLANGTEVHVTQDAVGSRHPDDRVLGLHRMEAAGATRTSVETALFEMLGAAGSDEFKAVQKLVM